MFKDLFIWLGFIDDLEFKERAIENMERDHEEYLKQKKFLTHQSRLYETMEFFDRIQQRKIDRVPSPIKGVGTYR